MRKLHYAGGCVVVSDAVCKAVMRYARALANNGTADIVTIPAVSDDGNLGAAHLLIGPASQLFSMPTEDVGDDLDDAEAVADIERKTRALQPSRPVWTNDMPDIPAVGAYDFL